MKKIFTLIVAMLTMTVAAMASDVVVGTDGYQPEGASFEWKLKADFKTQAVKAVIDLSTCQSTSANENIMTLGTEIGEWTPSTAYGCNLHIYYTPSTKSLAIHYLSANKNVAVYRYDATMSDIEGETTFAVDYQNGFTVNGKQVFSAARLMRMLGQTDSISFGSREGTTRSWATYKSVRVTDYEFVAPGTETYNSPAKLLLNGTYTRFDNATATVSQPTIDTYDITVTGLAVGNKPLGDLTVTGLAGTLNEGDYVSFDQASTTATLSNAGTYATQLGLSNGDVLPVVVDGYIYQGELTVDFTTTLGENQAVYSFNTNSAQTSDYTDTLVTTLNGEEAGYGSKSLTMTDYTDNHFDIVLKDVQFAAYGDKMVGDLTITELPGKTVAGITTFDESSYTVTFENCLSPTLQHISGAKVTGQAAGDSIYLHVEGEAGGQTFTVTYGIEPPKSEMFTDTLAISNDGDEWGFNDVNVSITPKGGDKYTMTIYEIESLGTYSFEVTGTLNSKGFMVYTSERAETPTDIEGWEDYPSYMSTNAKSKGGKLYGRFQLDLGGFGASYSDAYNYNFVYGTNSDWPETNGITAPKTVTGGQTTVYSISGARLNGLQHGLNIVRQADGKVVKVMKR